MADRFDRRRFIRTMGLTGAGLAAVGGGLNRWARPAHSQQPRPNILFILTDDQRYDAMSCFGHPPWLRTPNMDRIRNEGANFANAFVTTSLCSPSRASFLTGCYAHTHGVRTNERNDPRPDLQTFPMVLQAAGYNTAFIGKWHMAAKAGPRPGFDYWLSFLGQGKYIDPPLNENGRDFKAQGYMTDLLTDYALNFLKQPRNAPFCLYLSHKAVHGPFTPAERHKGLYEGEQFPEPANFGDTFENKPEWIRAGMVRGARREAMRQNKDKPVPPKIEPGPWNATNPGRTNYYRSLSAVDDGIGRVLDLLQQTGQLDNTIILFAGDNGYFHGEHRRGDKRLMYEESLRIPMVMRYPALLEPGCSIDQMMLNIDVAPTLLDLAGATAPDTMQGMSIAPILAGRDIAWRQSFLYEYFQEGWLPGIPTMFGVRTESWKYITYPKIDDLDEMYDLSADPLEMTNLAVDPKHDAKKKQLEGELERLLKQTNYEEAPRPNVQRPGKVVLHFGFDSDEGDRAVDSSGEANHGKITGAALVDGATGKARRFSGVDSIAVDKSDSLDCAMGPVSISAWVKPDKANGVVLAKGGQSHGYSLYLRKGKPVFAVRLANGLELVEGPETIGSDWTHLAAVLTGRAVLKLYVNGAEAASRQIPDFIFQDPNEAMEIGMDRATLVGDYEADNGFTGLIDDVKVYNGEVSPAQISAQAKSRP